MPDMNKDANQGNILTAEKLRRSVGLTIDSFDEELKDLELSAIKQMQLSGIVPSKIIAQDKYIVNTILAYVKGNFRFTDANTAIRFQQVFEANKNYMRSTTEYTQESSDKNG